ncbi:hypothetical protein HPB50_027048 [Hyalomma asiaticum]|uniref:Uncharacterized protein n=1 Tax=Hyalomma asiaticum TaxID=266040 RepID=A0ACB7RPS6_HYAAI|nr:hypothetical protein HPB50_027048 [Hyalomma asiaticum]
MIARVWCLSLVAALAHNALAVGPEIKVQALLVPCDAAPSNRSGSSTVQGFLSSKPALMACDKKLAIVLRINNTEEVEKEDVYLFVDEAVDHDSNDSVKLLEPLVVKVYQQPSVNGKLAEEVYAVANLSRPESLKACYSNDISAFQCGYDPDELYPKVRRRPYAQIRSVLN